MKHMKKIASLILALAMVFSLATAAFAAGEYSITVKNANTSISINGKTYSAYKLFDVIYNEDKTAYSYTIDKDFENFSYTYTDADKKTVTVKGEALIAYVATLTANSEALNAIAEAALSYATTNAITADGSAAAANETAAISLDAAGYYLVAGQATAPENQTITAACALTTTDPSAQVNVKADAPSVDKKIVEGDNKVESNDAAIGDTVNFEITSKVPDMTGYEKYYFVVNDTLSKGLTYNANSLTIKIGEKTLTKDTDYTVTTGKTTDGSTTIEIVFKNFIQYKTPKGAAIVITYSATLNADAVIGVAGNPNKVTLTYSNNPNTKDDGDPENPDKPGPNSPVGETPEEETRTYVTDLTIIKTDKDGNKLAGAEFDIEGTALNTVIVTKDVYTVAENGTYYKLKDGTYTTTAPTTGENGNEDKYASTTVKYTKETKTETIIKQENVKYHVVVGDDGVLNLEGLPAGEYTITETKAPDGYNLLKEPIKVTITWTAPAEGQTNCTWTYTGTDKEGNVCTNHITIINQTGSELPETGGMGTTIFYVLGFLMMTGAAVLLITKRRMNAN